MSRQRKTNRALPQRVYIKFDAYYFVPVEPMLAPKTGKKQRWIRLCSVSDGLSPMLASLAEILRGSPTEVVGSMAHLCAEFKAKKLGKFSKEVQSQYSQYLSVIADEFEEFHAAQVTTKELSDFLHEKFHDKANTAKKYAGLMRKVFKYAISSLGLRADNPIDQLDLSDFETSRREVLLTHEQVARIRNAGMTSKPRKSTGLGIPTASGPMFSCLIDMSYLLWARAIDIRTLKETQIENGRIRIQPSKTLKTSGKIVDITITPSIQSVVDRARAIKLRYGIVSLYLFPTQKGGAYTKNGLSSMWDRAKERAGMTEDVVFKDLRALGATDAAKAGENKGDIQTRLAHTSERTTDIYIKESVPETSRIDVKLPWQSI